MPTQHAGLHKEQAIYSCVDSVIVSGNGWQVENKESVFRVGRGLN